MGPVRYITLFALMLTLFGHVCFAQMNVLSEEELDEFVAEEGVCDIRLPDTCNTDNDVEEIRSMTDKNKTIFTNDSLPNQIQTIDTSHVFQADYGRLGADPNQLPSQNYYYPNYNNGYN